MSSMGSGSAVQEAAPAAFGRGAIIGRYVVLGLIGRGGMGEVYGAYDPELDRKIALKLFRVKPGNGVSPTEGRQRLLREAQAIARLSHPNVVVVYDVGMFEDKVFIAMEFVDGHTTTYWLESGDRSWREVLDVFVGAGRGLVAAHEKGIVHRDFKPDNIMVGHDGQVRVMDFGLARQANERPLSVAPATPPEPMPIQTSGAGIGGSDDTVVLRSGGGGALPAEIRSSVPGVLDLRLTRPGAMMGTPAYMASEQFRGMAADARSDQFSFCVSLYEALYRERPFPGDRLSGLAHHVVRGEVRPPPAGSKVPAWVRRVLMRGLRPRPSERWPSMTELLEELGRDPRVTRRRWAIAIGAVLLAATAAVVGLRPLFVSRVPVCGGGPDMVADAWEIPRDRGLEPPRQSRVHQAFLSTQKSYAADVFATVRKALNDYAGRWAAMYRENCEATHVRGDQSAEVLDLRMACLQERLGGFRALTEVFASATGEVVENAVTAANSLASLDRCSDVPLLRAVIKPPEDPAVRQRVHDVRIGLADVKASFDAGRWSSAVKRTPALIAEARNVGYLPLVAETLLLRGTVLSKAGDAAGSERALIEAFWLGDSSRHDEIRAEAAARLVFVVGYQEGKSAEAERWATAATSVLRRMGGHDLLRAWLLNDLGCVYLLKEDNDNALKRLTDALALKTKVLGHDHPDVWVSKINLALVLHSVGRGKEALQHLDEAERMLEASLGPGHPDLANNLSNEGEILRGLGRFREARTFYEKSRVISERELSPDDPIVAYALTGIGMTYLQEGNPAGSIAFLERAYRIRRAHEPNPSSLAETGFALAQALWESDGSRPRALRLVVDARNAFAATSSRTKLAEVDGWLRDHRPD